MKTVAFLLLAITTAGVAYLTYTKYLERRELAAAVDAMRDPDLYTTKQFAERAGLECDLFTSIRTRQSPGAGLVPQEFTCYTRSGGSWRIVESECSDPEMRSSKEHPEPGVVISNGSPIAEGQLYKPFSVLCWRTRMDPSGRPEPIE